MAIVKMKHVRLLAEKKVQTDLLRELVWLKSVDVSVPSPEQIGDSLSSDSGGETGEKWAQMAELLRDVITVLSPYSTERKGLFTKPRTLSRVDFDAFEKDHRRLIADAQDVLHVRDERAGLESEKNKNEALRDALAVWKDVPVDLDKPLSPHTEYRFCVLPAELAGSFDPETFADENGIVLETVAQDSRLIYLLAVYPLKNKTEIVRALEAAHFSQVSFRNLKNTPEENMMILDEQIAQLSEKYDALEERLRRYAEKLNGFEDALDMVTNVEKIYSVRERLLCTENVFLLDGWCPVSKTDKVQALCDRFGAYVQFDDPTPEEEPPILLKNNRFAAAFEGVTEMYALPTYRGVDPNFMMAPFFFIFFGMMMGDVGYGALISLVCGLALLVCHLSPGMKNMMKMFFWCGLSTMIWGVLFGSCFGDVIPVFSATFGGREITVAPLWFNPLDEPLMLFGISFAIGFLQILVGLGMRGFMLIRDHHVGAAICDVGFWMILLLGIPVYAAPALLTALPPVMGTVGLVMICVGAAGLIFTQGRDKKNPIMKLLMGLYSLYDITGYLSDILSYSRILALCLSGAVIAMVFNKLAAMLGGGIVGFIVFVIIFVIGTVLNIALSMLSAYVHASRLQFIEFFSKFYESGGVAYDPLQVQTTYTEIKHNEQ